MIDRAEKREHCVILSVSSDIGLALADDWLSRGFSVSGTHRTWTPQVESLVSRGLTSVQMDLSNEVSTEKAAASLSRVPWSRLVLAAGSQDPVGLFERVKARDWARSIETNFIRQFEFLSWMLPHRNRDIHFPSVLAFAGGATNSATTHYSAYTVSKIASIKMIELLAKEMPDVSFSILGPGWVKTKIHNATMRAGSESGENLKTTRDHFERDDFYPMKNVVEAINWIMLAPPSAVSGRNFSAVHDPWGTSELIDALNIDPELYKLRRYGNNRL